MSVLLTAVETAEDPARFVARHGQVLATFDHHTQDSGNVSWLVATEDGELFVKSAGPPGPPPAGAPVPYLDLDGRIALLRNAVTLARSVDHPVLARLRHVVESPTGPLLVYDRAPGELVGTTAERRADPTTAYQRLARLPAERQLMIMDQLLDAHAALAAAGWVAADLYDGCLLVDFATDRLTLVDLDTYSRGPTTNTMGRMFGSDRFMAPEEYALGATIDQRTTVFTLARIAVHFGTRLTEDLDDHVGGAALAALLRRATAPDPAGRPADVASFTRGWSEVRRSGSRSTAPGHRPGPGEPGR